MKISFNTRAQVIDSEVMIVLPFRTFEKYFLTIQCLDKLRTSKKLGNRHPNHKKFYVM